MPDKKADENREKKQEKKARAPYFKTQTIVYLDELMKRELAKPGANKILFEKGDVKLILEVFKRYMRIRSTRKDCNDRRSMAKRLVVEEK